MISLYTVKEVNCPICGKFDYKILFKENFAKSEVDEKTFSARRTPEKVLYQIVKCNRCNLVYSNPIFEEENLQKLYKKSVFTYSENLPDLRETYGFYIKKVESALPNKENFLDIGCGNGFMLEKAQGIGFKSVWGVEPSLDSINKARSDIKSKIKNDVFKEGLFREKFFDLVCIFQTLDHVSNPNGFLKAVYKILKRGGVVLAINHNVASFFAKILGERYPIFDIEHTFLYDKETMKKIFEKNGFKVLWVESTFNIYPLNYWLRMFPLPGGLKKLLVNFFSVTSVINKKIKIKAGNLGLAATK